MPAVAQVAQERLRRERSRAAGSRSWARKIALTPKRRRVDRERPAGAEAGDERAGDHRADDPGGRHREAAQRVRLLQQLGADRHRRQPGRGRVEERCGGARDRLQDDELPDLRAVREHEQRDRALRAAAHDVGGQHHRAARQAVGEDAADEQERDERDRLAPRRRSRGRSPTRSDRARRRRARRR